MKFQLQQKEEETELLKRNIKGTKLMEMEMELKTYADECVRLRHTLEKVMESKDPLSDPNEIAQIEEQFQK